MEIKRQPKIDQVSAFSPITFGIYIFWLIYLRTLIRETLKADC